MDNKIQGSNSRELKYLFPPESKAALLCELKLKLQRDALHYQNKVNSLYFDTNDFQFAMDKASSDYCKSKIRIRWYETQKNSDSSACWLEIKNKLGSTRRKSRVLIPSELTNIYEQVHSSDLSSNQLMSFIKEQLQIRHPELASSNIKPVFTVSYLRSRFYDPFSDSRIACDSDIYAKAFSIDTRFSNNSTLLNSLVLEVKCKQETLPSSLRSLSNFNFRKAAFSKYYQSFCQLTDYQQ